MDKKMLQKTFREWKKVSGADYAITNPDGLGDCTSCVNASLCDKYGEDSKGMFVKHWTRGMNADYPLDSKTRDGEDRINHIYLAHDLDEGMAKTVYEVFGENYNVLPAEYDPYKCFCLYEKGTPVWSVSWGKAYTSEFTNVKEATIWMDKLFYQGDNPTLTRLF